jgi:anti-sigma regulatory factor (Ser/Thr protein kinase)
VVEVVTGTVSSRRRRGRCECWDLPAEVSIVGKVREITRAILAAWGLAESIDDVELMVDELVGNAVVHGQGPIRLLLRLEPATAERSSDQALVCEVTDTSPVMPRRSGTPARRDDEDGRGLWIVEHLAEAFGVRPTECGKVVWFRYGLHTERAPS